MDKGSGVEIIESEVVDLSTICDNCGEILPLNVWGEKHSVCTNCGRSLDELF